MLARILGSLLFLTGLCNDAGSQDVAKPNEKHGEQGTKHKSPANHLKGETSPYLLQHLHNPVDWYPWGKEAIAKAKKEGKPIFLSIGYSACHWCHVMERESFENEEIAKLMNQWFVCIKVDREERPDIDEIYMAATMALNNGQGGWPMSVFLTPDLEPFFAGTYYPPEDKFGRPGFMRVLTRLNELWTTRREDVIKDAKQITEFVRKQEVLPAAGKLPEFAELFTKAVKFAGVRFDKEHGGFAQAPRWAPKFPHCTELAFLLRYASDASNDDKKEALAIVETTLEKMARGGIYDQIGGGFARYSVDREWTVPHFEKMLYDNSQLASLYLEAWQATGKAFYKRIATEILDYVTREMTSPEGGFYSTTDADSEGEEGKFFVWSLEEVEKIAGEDAKPVVRFFGVTKEGNFEGHNILTNRVGREGLAKEFGQPVAKVTEAIEGARRKLYEARSLRVRPALDDKVLSSWNGLMLSAFARAAMVLGDAGYLKTARANAAFLLDEMVVAGRLMRTRRSGRTHLQGYLEDHAFVVAGLLDLYEADLDLRWLEAAQKLHAAVEERFADAKTGSYFSTADDHEKLIMRRSSAQESSLPSDVGVAAMNAARLGLLAGEPKLLDRARAVLARYAAALERFPNGFSQLLLLAQLLDSNPAEVYVVGAKGADATDGFLTKLRQQWPPHRVFVWVDPANRGSVESLLPAAKGKALVDGQPAAYVCYQGVCKKPLVDPAQMK